MSESDESTDNQPVRFKIGNHAWKARSTHGRHPIFAGPDDLRDACEQYFQWVDDNPLQAVDLAKFQGTATQVQVPRMRAMTMTGLCIYLDIGTSTWADYRNRANFSEVIAWAEMVIYQQKFEGAAADMLNANIISRELGLVDKQEVMSKGEAITHIDSEYVEPDQ